MQNTNYSVEEILARLQIKTLNEMQLASIEANKKHNNIILLSATGSGKNTRLLITAFTIS
jgi:Lhr-like helicase